MKKRFKAVRMITGWHLTQVEKKAILELINVDMTICWNRPRTKRYEILSSDSGFYRVVIFSRYLKAWDKQTVTVFAVPNLTHSSQPVKA